VVYKNQNGPRTRDNPGFAVVGAFEPLGGGDELGLAEGGGEVEDGSVGDRESCEPHDSDRTQAALRCLSLLVVPQLGAVGLQSGEHAGETIARRLAGKETKPFK
jgi:hypothetical protein